MVARVFTRSCRRARPAGASRTPCRALAFHDIGADYLILFRARIHRLPDRQPAVVLHAAHSHADTVLINTVKWRRPAVATGRRAGRPKPPPEVTCGAAGHRAGRAGVRRRGTLDRASATM